jgi:hypothetical protein
MAAFCFSGCWAKFARNMHQRKSRSANHGKQWNLGTFIRDSVLILDYSSASFLDFTALVKIQKKKIVYASTGASALLAEVLQQCIGAYAIILTMVSAFRSGYYNINSLKYAPASGWALTMYAGAMLWSCGFVIMLAFVLWSLPLLSTIWQKRENILAAVVDGEVDRNSSTTREPRRPSYTYSPTNEAQEDKIFDFNPPIQYGIPVAEAEILRHELIPFKEAIQRMGLSEQIISHISKAFMILLLPFAGQWIFWIGFVKNAGGRYV